MMTLATDVGRDVQSGPTRPALGAAFAGLPFGDLLDRMTPPRRRNALMLLDWLLDSDLRQTPGHIVEQLCERLIEAGLPLDRYGSSTSMVTAEHDAIGRHWVRGEGVTETLYVRSEAEDPDYVASPFHRAAETRQWVELWLPETPDTAFGIVPSLKAMGLTHYICVPTRLTNESKTWLTFATRAPSGFSEQDLLLIAVALPVIVNRIDARVAWSMLDKLLRTYVGEEPHNAILAGRAKRGEVSAIRASMLVADLRDSTGHIADLSAVQAVGLFNDLFDCLVPPIETRRGEVLKYLGDGLLAIFRETKTGQDDAADRALEAAQAGLQAIETFNAAHPHRRAMQIGVALHYGEIAYGNVGSGLRLDFTVIGRDVALASRVAGMNARLNQPVLLTAAFVAQMRHDAERIGLFPARGFAEPVEVFRPKTSRSSSAPAWD